jgi:hypothetical protein
MLSDGALRSRFAADAPSRVESFDVQRIADRYETLLLEAARR